MVHGGRRVAAPRPLPAQPVPGATRRGREALAKNAPRAFKNGFGLILTAIGGFAVATQHPRDRSRNMVALLLVMVHPAAIFCAFARLRLYHVMNSGMLLRVFAAGFVLSIFAASHEKVTQFILLHLTMGHSNLDKAIGATAFAGGPYSVGASLAFFVILSFGTTAFVEEVFKLGTSTSRVLLYGVGNQYSSDAALTAGKAKARQL